MHTFIDDFHGRLQNLLLAAAQPVRGRHMPACLIVAPTGRHLVFNLGRPPLQFWHQMIQRGLAITGGDTPQPPHTVCHLALARIPTATTARADTFWAVSHAPRYPTGVQVQLGVHLPQRMDSRLFTTLSDRAQLFFTFLKPFTRHLRSEGRKENPNRPLRLETKRADGAVMPETLPRINRFHSYS